MIKYTKKIFIFWLLQAPIFIKILQNQHGIGLCILLWQHFSCEQVAKAILRSIFYQSAKADCNGTSIAVAFKQLTKGI